MSLAKVRRTFFWGFDRLKGSTIKNHFKEIEEINNSSSQTNEKQLNEILKFAKDNVPYYKQLNYHSLNELPVITKQTMKDNYEQFNSGIFRKKDIHKMSTSGSTGTPFTIRQNPGKRKRTIADLIYFNEISGQTLGDRYMYINTFPKGKSKIESFKQNVVPINLSKLDNDTLEKMRSILLKDKTINSILAVASSYEKLANYLYDKGDTPEIYNINTLFSSSALLKEDTKIKLEKVFGCPVIDRYSNQENGVLAQTRGTYDVYHINRASYHTELLKLDCNDPVQKGEIGRIVVTDLYNFAMPMLRYDTGDLAISDDTNRNKLRTLRNIQGRRVDAIFDTKGNMLTPHIWSIHMRKYQKLKQWQFIQENRKDYVLKINGDEGVYTKKDFDRTLRNILGEDANIKIEYVNKIPVLSSGKFKNTVNNYIP